MAVDATDPMTSNPPVRHDRPWSHVWQANAVTGGNPSDRVILRLLCSQDLRRPGSPNVTGAAHNHRNSDGANQPRA